MKTTKEQWDQYKLDQMNHEARIKRSREFLNDILDSVSIHGMYRTKEIFESALNASLSMDAPNEPGYYRANND